VFHGSSLERLRRSYAPVQQSDTKRPDVAAQERCDGAFLTQTNPLRRWWNAQSQHWRDARRAL